MQKIVVTLTLALLVLSLAVIGCASSGASPNDVRESPDESIAEDATYVEALPPPVKPVIAIQPVENTTGVAELDTLSMTLNETIAVNLGLIGDYQLVSGSTAEQIDGFDYRLSGTIARRDAGGYVGTINVTIGATGVRETIEYPVRSVLDVFDVADELSRDVLNYFTEQRITVGTVAIVDENPSGGEYTVRVDRETAGTTLRELTLLTGVRHLEIRRDDVPLYSGTILVQDGIRIEVRINSQAYRDTPVALVFVPDGFGGAIAGEVEAGFQQAVLNYSLAGTVVKPRSLSQVPAAIQRLAAAGVELIILPGFELESALLESARRHPEVTFLGIDIALPSVGSIPKNARTVLFREQDAGYLAGIVAGSFTRQYAERLPQLNPDPVVGAVLGMEIPAVMRYADGFEAGAVSVDPGVSVIRYVAGTFSDHEAGRRGAAELIGRGVDVVFNIAGGTGIGAIDEARRNGVLAIGVDVDQYDIAPDTVITSATKDYHSMTYIGLQRWLTGTLPTDSPVLELGIRDGITPLASFHRFDPYVPFEIRRRIDAAINEIAEETE